MFTAQNHRNEWLLPPGSAAKKRRGKGEMEYKWVSFASNCFFIKAEARTERCLPWERGGEGRVVVLEEEMGEGKLGRRSEACIAI